MMEPRSTLIALLAVIGSMVIITGASGVTISEAFESSTANSPTPPAGWSLVTVAGSPSYATSASNAGSDGTGGSTGLAGEVSSTDFIDTDLPGGYLVNSTNLNLNFAVTGSFDFRLVHEGTFDDVIFIIGAIADGLTDADAGELLSVKMAEAASGGVASQITDGTGSDNRVATTSTTLTDDTWYTASFAWVPTSGTTGDFTITVNDFSSDLYTLSATGFTFDSAIAQVGFGSVNDTIRFDNVEIVNVPEPMSLALLGLGGLALVRRRG